MPHPFFVFNSSKRARTASDKLQKGRGQGRKKDLCDVVGRGKADDNGEARKRSNRVDNTCSSSVLDSTHNNFSGENGRLDRGNYLCFGPYLGFERLFHP